MRLLNAIFVLVFTTLIVPTANAYTVAEVDINEIVPATAERPELHLNGASLRELYLLIETYVGALYLEETSTDPDAILNSEKHKRMVFHVMMKKVGARRIANALQEALIMNITKEEHKKLTPDIDLMLSFFEGRMHKGEESFFDYIPGKGTRVTVNDQVKGIIPGKTFYRALLSIWIGENPVGRTFKEEILGLNRQKSASQVAGQ